MKSILVTPLFVKTCLYPLYSLMSEEVDLLSLNLRLSEIIRSWAHHSHHLDVRFTFGVEFLMDLVNSWN